MIPILIIRNSQRSASGWPLYVASLDELADRIKKITPPRYLSTTRKVGGGWVPGRFTGGARNRTAWLGATLLGVDVDTFPKREIDATLQGPLDRLARQTCAALWHRSARGFRLVFLLDSEVTDIEDYAMVHAGARALVSDCLPDGFMVDHGVCDPSRFWFGPAAAAPVRVTERTVAVSSLRAYGAQAQPRAPVAVTVSDVVHSESRTIRDCAILTDEDAPLRLGCGDVVSLWDMFWGTSPGERGTCFAPRRNDRSAGAFWIRHPDQLFIQDKPDCRYVYRPTTVLKVNFG